MALVDKSVSEKLGSVAFQISILISILLYSWTAISDVLKIKALSEAYESADIVAVVTITQHDTFFVGKSPCGTRYVAELVEKFKGQIPGEKTISFGRTDGLHLDGEYLVFLKKENDAEAIFQNLPQKIQIMEDKARAVEIIKCKGIIPGYVVDPDFAWESIDGGYYIVGQLPNPVPPSINVEKRGISLWFLPKIDVLSYLRDINAPGSK